jgi:hypothetical protein
MLTPVMSLGSKSGVHWMRRKSSPMESASARASIVLPTPGTSSSSTCPSQSSARINVSIVSRLPTITRFDIGAQRIGKGSNVLHSTTVYTGAREFPIPHSPFRMNL